MDMQWCPNCLELVLCSERTTKRYKSNLEVELITETTCSKCHQSLATHNGSVIYDRLTTYSEVND